MIITGLYIVKNEENNLRRSINSIRDVCDEVIVIDTGSQDNTVELAESLGAKVCHFTWVNDFSKARNFALSKANGDLIIFIDADEWFPEPLNQEDRAYLESLVAEGYTAFDVLRSELDHNSLSVPGYNTRMLQGKKGLYYVGAIHECLNDPTGTYYLPERFLLYHSGYDAGRSTEKAKRNIALLYDQLEQEVFPQRRLMMLFYIARENWVLENVEESQKFLDMYFELWQEIPGKDRPAHVGVYAYDFTVNSYIRLDEKAVPNEKLAQICESFVTDFPRHPASYYALANYYYTRHRDYDASMSALEKVEECCLGYNVEDYPHDYVGAAAPRANARMLRGNILFDRGKKAEAFDCYASILQSTVPSSGFLRRLLNLIKDQPMDAVISFLNAVPREITADYIELLLSQLVFFPELKDAYLYFSVQLLRLTKKQSDISAIAALISDNSPDLAIHVGKTLFETEKAAAGKLWFLAAMFAGPEILGELPSYPVLEGLLDCYFAGKAPEKPEKEEIGLLGSLFPLVLFIGSDERTGRFLKLFEKSDFELANLILHYCFCNTSKATGKLLDLISVDETRLDAAERAAFYTLMGRVNLSFGDFDDAWSYLRDAFELAPSEISAYYGLRTLASVAPEYEKLVFGLLDRFRGAAGKGPVKSERLAAISGVLGGAYGDN